jgi:hypothetical protein
MLATRKLREFTSRENSDDSDLVEGEDFVDALQFANESLSTAVGAGGTNNSGMADVYVEFIEEWCRLPTLDPSLVSLTFTSLAFRLSSKISVHISWLPSRKLLDSRAPHLRCGLHTSG